MTEKLQKPQHRSFGGDEIDLRVLFKNLWREKWIVGGVTVVFALVALIASLILPDIYRSETLLAPSENQGSGGLADLAAQYGGLARLAGIDLTNTSSDKTVLGLEVLKSRKFITDFIDRHEALVPLMAATGWNRETREVVYDKDVYDASSEQWVRKVRPPKQVVPSPQEAYEAFLEILSVSRDGESGFVTVAIEHYSPDIARDWTSYLVADLNNSIMERDVSEAEQAIDYLNEQIEKTSLAELKSVFFNLIEKQTKTVMLAKVSDEYLLKTIDPPVAPEEKIRPKRIVIVILGTIAGFLLSVLFVLVFHGFRSEKTA